MDEVLTDFRIDPLHGSCGLSDIDQSGVMRVGGNGEDLGGELDWVAFGVLGLGGLARRLAERGTGSC